jgi:hypothetical protein
LAILGGAGWATTAGGQANNINGKCDIYVASEHAEVQPSNTSAMQLGSANLTHVLGRLLCVTKTTVPPVSANLTTGASVNTTGAGIVSPPNGLYFCQGMTWSGGTGATTGNWGFNILTTSAYFKNCTFIKGGTTAAQTIVGSNSGVELVFDNTTMQFGATGDGLSNNNQSGKFVWRNTASAIQGAVIPTTFVSSAFAGEMLLEALDLSAVTGNLVNLGSSLPTRVVMRNCKIAGGVTVVTGALGYPSSGTVDLIRCDSGATNYRHERYTAQGTQTVETTIVRTGGATDGTTPISWKIVTQSTAWYLLGFDTMPMAIWNDTTATNRVVTVFGITAAGGLPNNDDIWIEIEYPGSATTPIGTIANTTKADTLASGVAVASDGSTWGGGATAFKLVATLSSPQTQMKGPFLIVVKVAKPSTTFYIDPAAVLS